MKNPRVLFAILSTMIVGACSDTAVVEPPPLPEQPTTLMRDVPADTGKTGHYTFFRLRDSSIVSLADSATGSWDIAFNATSIITNSGTRGPGGAGWRLLSGVEFDTLSSTPAGDYSTADVSKEWYTYTGPTGTPPHAILANPGIVLLLRTADGKHAKLQIISYYKGAPASPAGTEPARFYTFRYFYQPDGSRTLSN